MDGPADSPWAVAGTANVADDPGRWPLVGAAQLRQITLLRGHCGKVVGDWVNRSLEGP